ncbi:class I SAM-dependent methyltransferase [Streptacidiphilus jiangxiensis]|uniref:Ubiquinone/menaquinone biosynthesis C-methylase UbiE n=1 Tax=Streptacidiphilus jiangxiensis TaxID=235985 RepID=A0A1H7TL45_STRJI|nr:class I SAM-dependent methyltransferase [Streptacidiphilus jiangxiensis]SEL85511.1 Ubiquinone/menaquinone biosynthesis C-methylase UbiE [Streptacidiphilus jiangxiensis]
MPTLPPEGAVPPSQQPHQAREVAESFGVDPERYDRARPRYPDALVAAVLDAAAGASVVDVGIGTGIVARQFRAAGCSVLGVEADARMAAWAREHGGFEVEVARFEDWDPAGRAFDAVVSGQTWHWIDPAAGAVRAARALRAGGRLAAFWNVDQPSSEVAEAFDAVYRRVLPGSLAAGQWAAPGESRYGGLTTRAADGIRASGAFGDPQEWHFGWERTWTRDQWLDQLPTTGGHTRLPAARLAEVLAGVAEAVDAMGGAFTMRYTAVVVAAERRLSA